MDYDEIADELDLGSIGVGIAKVAYFDEDFIILTLQFDNAFVGIAASKNVIVDLQEDKSTFYLFTEVPNLLREQ